MIYEIDAAIVRGTPRWGQRAHAAVFRSMASPLIYLIPEHPSQDEIATDWKIMLMVKVNEKMQDAETGFIPIMSTYDEVMIANIPTIPKLLNVEKK